MPIQLRRDGDVCSESENYFDTYSLSSQATTTIDVGGGLASQMVREKARKGIPFNIMAVGPTGSGKTTLLSALFGNNLDIPKSKTKIEDPLNPPVTLDSKKFGIIYGNVRLKLAVHESRNYGEAICYEKTYGPLVQFIESQFVDYYKQESSIDRRSLQDNMIHCLFFFISAFGHGLSELDIDFLKAVNGKVNIIPIIAWAEALTVVERDAMKQRIRDDLEKNKIDVYQMEEPEIEDTDEVKIAIKEIQDSCPYAIASIDLNSDCSLSVRDCDWGQVDCLNKEHSDYLHLRNMFYLRMTGLVDTTHEIFYEEFRSAKLQNRSARSNSS